MLTFGEPKYLWYTQTVQIREDVVFHSGLPKECGPVMCHSHAGRSSLRGPRLNIERALAGEVCLRPPRSVCWVLRS